MRKDAIQLEESRLTDGESLEMPRLHERHRAFPAAFENRQHCRILDLAAGVGYVARNIRDGYAAGQMFCNDISPSALTSLKALGLPVVSYTLDHDWGGFPFKDGSFDALIALATIEHIIHVDDFVREIHRILDDQGCFYVSAPNYASLLYLSEIVLTGRTFHNPLHPDTRYEFYAHVRYFTYRTMLEYLSSFGFVPEAVYLPLPQASTTYQAIRAKSPFKAAIFRQVMNFFYHLSPRWSSEPVICLRKSANKDNRPFRKVIL